MSIPAGHDSPLMQAALAGLSRDALWKNPPPLAEGCEHDFELLPIIEFRQTVICANCGGLDAERSLRLQREPLKIMTVPGRGIYMDGARIASRIRADGPDQPGPLSSAP